MVQTAAVIKCNCNGMNMEMSRQTSNDRSLLQNAPDRSPRIAGNYVRNLAVRLEEQIGETGSPKDVMHAQRSRNVRISFRIGHQSTSDGTVSRSNKSSTLEGPGNVTGSAENRSCIRPAKRSVPIPSDALSLSPESLYAENSASSDVLLVDASETDVYSADIVSSNADTDSDRRRTLIKSVATLNMEVSRDVLTETGCTDGSAASVGCGQ